MFRPMVIPNTPIQKEPAPLRIDNFGGVDYSTTPTQIAENRSPDMLNMTLDERGKPSKRTGYDQALPVHLGPGQINGMYQWKGRTLIAQGINLFAFLDADIT